MLVYCFVIGLYGISLISVSIFVILDVKGVLGVSQFLGFTIYLSLNYCVIISSTTLMIFISYLLVKMSQPLPKSFESYIKRPASILMDRNSAIAVYNEIDQLHLDEEDGDYNPD